MFIESMERIIPYTPFNHDISGLLPIELEAFTEDGKRIYILPNGEKYPSVTTVLADENNDGLRQWRERVGHAEADKISSRATKRGTILHENLEKYLKNSGFSVSGMMPDQKMLVKSVLPILTSINKVVMQESCLYSTNLKIAGRFDLIGEWNNVLSVIDFKTSNKPKQAKYIEKYYMQCAAYALMFNECYYGNVDQIVVIIAVENSKPQVFIEKVSTWVKPLLAKVEAYHNKNKNETMDIKGN